MQFGSERGLLNVALSQFKEQSEECSPSFKHAFFVFIAMSIVMVVLVILLHVIAATSCVLFMTTFEAGFSMIRVSLYGIQDIKDITVIGDWAQVDTALCHGMLSW